MVSSTAIAAWRGTRLRRLSRIVGVGKEAKRPREQARREHDKVHPTKPNFLYSVATAAALLSTG